MFVRNVLRKKQLNVIHCMMNLTDNMKFAEVMKMIKDLIIWAVAKLDQNKSAYSNYINAQLQVIHNSHSWSIVL